MNYFDKKIIWITGASSGIGRELAIQLSNYDCTLILTARRKEQLEDTKLKCGNANVQVYPFDLSKIDEIDDFSLRVQKEVGAIDILINNAGVSAWSGVEETNFKVYQDVMTLDFYSIVKLTKSILPSMISRKSGQIVSVSSLLGKFAIKKRSVYASAKHALQGFMDALRAEVYEHNIKVNTVAPGYVETEVGIKALTGDGSEYGANDRGHDTKGMKADTAANIIIKAIAKNKREHYVIPLFSFSRFALYLARFAPGLAARIARNYNEDEK